MWPSIEISECISSCKQSAVSLAVLTATVRIITSAINKLLVIRIYLSMALQPFVGPWPLFSFLILYTSGRTPWMGDQPVARPLPTQNNKNRINAHPDIHNSSGIRTHDPSVPAGEDCSCLDRATEHCDRRHSRQSR
jgi:hypothetical protein